MQNTPLATCQVLFGAEVTATPKSVTWYAQHTSFICSLQTFGASHSLFWLPGSPKSPVKMKKWKRLLYVTDVLSVYPHLWLKIFWESFCCLLGKRPISQAVATGWLWGEGEPPLIPELHSAKYAYCIVSMGHCFGNILKIWFPPFLHLLWLQIDKLACLTVIWIHESGDGNAI